MAGEQQKSGNTGPFVQVWAAGAIAAAGVPSSYYYGLRALCGPTRSIKRRSLIRGAARATAHSTDMPQTSGLLGAYLAARQVFTRGAARATGAAGWLPLSGSKPCQAGAPRLLLLPL